ncbi:NUDIX hydrolase [Gordonia sp. DT30]|uniref:NUDIX hydrolase n=1 Tax=unclassified Gordonia (in: high G+C Gram-positive bacteria) TaxID=2657482 RepID=UPI003CEDC568
MTVPFVIRVSAVVLRDATGAVLTVRKRDTDRFMFPGGKPEPGETPLQTAVRECAEELRLHLDGAALQDYGVHRSAAANEDGFDVEAAVFVWPGAIDRATSGIVAAAEIAELRWQPLDGSPLPADLAPLLVQEVFPMLPRGPSGEGHSSPRLGRHRADRS